MTTTNETAYWKKWFGLELFKVNYYAKWLLYHILGIKLPKLKNQRSYWESRGHVYMDEIIQSGYLNREIFFQNLLIDELKNLKFSSAFEAGCGFGWNIRRIKEAFPGARVGGLDFSYTQLSNSKTYLNRSDIAVVNGDNCHMPLNDNAYDIGFSIGVFMNIHSSKIEAALREMVRVCRKYIIHIEYDENHTTPELRKKRSIKTNIVSHNYKSLYEAMGIKPTRFLTYHDFGEAYREHESKSQGKLDRWEGFEGPEKYIVTVQKIY